MHVIDVIISEMTKGNFSFLILVVGTAQIIVMVKNYKLMKKNSEDSPE